MTEGPQRQIRIGVGTPQANPTVEPEWRRLLPTDVDFYVTRLTSGAADARQRLIEYIEDLPAFLSAYGSLRLDGFAFACTGSSYMVGAAWENQIATQVGAETGYPIVTATAAIAAALDRRGVKRLALISPYPDWLTEASVGYWTDAGHDVVGVTRVEIGGEDTAAIYGLAGDSARRALAEADLSAADAVLLTGTGLPTLATIACAQPGSAIPILSSNLCLAETVLARFGREPALA